MRVTSFITGALACLLAMAPAQAQEKDGFKPKINEDLEKLAPPKEEAPAKASEARKPTISIDDLYKVVPTQSEEKLQAAIESLYSIIDYAEDDDPEKPGYLARLANLYWERGEAFFMKAYSSEMDKVIRDAYDSEDKDRIAAAEAQREQLLTLQKEWRDKGVKVFQEIESKFPDFAQLDMVLFYLGNFLSQMGQNDEGYDAYVKLITRFPDSKFIPDALVNIGDYYLEHNEPDTAAQFYDKVLTFKDSRLYGYAMYKQAWCYYNTGDYQQAFTAFVGVINFSKEQEAAGTKGAIGLKKEAQKDLVLAYSQVGVESEAIPFFKEIAPDSYLDLSGMLAQVYIEQGEESKAIVMLKSLIKATFKEDPNNPKVLEFQRQIVVATDKTTNKLETRKEVIRLVELFNHYKSKDPKLVESQESQIESMLLRMAISYHLEAQRIGENKTMLLAKELYAKYLELFPEAEGRYQITMYLGILNYQLNDYAAAVKYYEKVLEIEPEGKYAKDAAYSALLCYYKLVDLTASSKLKSEDQGLDESQAREIPEVQQGMIRACNRYLALGPEDPEEVTQCKFAIANIYYDFNHFTEAIPALQDMVVNHTDHQLTPDAAKMLLSSFMMTRDIRNLNQWAERLYGMPSIAQGELLTIINDIRDRAQFNRCFEYEFDKLYERAANCFIDYAKNFPSSNLVDKAYYNAALNFQRAKRYLMALQANAGLYSCCAKSSPLGPRALYLIADTFRMAGVYEQAAINFEKYVKDHKSSDGAMEALMYAAKFRRSLGQYKEAVADYDLFMRVFPDDPRVPAVFFDKAMLIKKQNPKDSKPAIKAFDQYLKKYAKTGGVNLYLSAHREIGELYLSARDYGKASRMFQRVIDQFKEFTPEEKQTIDAKGVSAIAWAFFNMGDEAYREARKVTMNRRKLKESTEEKITKILEAEKYYKTVMALKHPYWSTAALYRIGSAWQRFATDFENSPTPSGMSIDEEEYYRLMLTEEAGKFRQKAVAAYKKCIEEAVSNRVFNEFTEKAEKELSELEFQFSGMKEYRVRPNYFTMLSNPPGFKRPAVKLESKGREDKQPGAVEPPAGGGDTQGQ